MDLNKERQKICDELTTEQAMDNILKVFAGINLKLSDHLLLMASLQKIQEDLTDN